MDEWKAALASVAEHTAATAKISGLNTTIKGDWAADTFSPSIEHALDCFGPERLMCGSDWPVALLDGSYEGVWRTTRQLIETLAPAHAGELLGENARRVYAFGAAASSPHHGG